MGFWKTAGSIAKSVASEVEKQGNELKAIKMQLEGKSTHELKKIAKDDGFFNTPQKRAMARKILKERGEYEE